MSSSTHESVDVVSNTAAEPEARETIDYELLVGELVGVWAHAYASESTNPNAYWDSLAKVHAVQVDLERNPDKREFAEALLAAPYAEYYQGILEAYAPYRDKMDELTEDQQQAYQEARAGKVKANHDLRDLLLHQRDSFTLAQMTEWYARLNGGKHKSSRELIVGAVCEVAAYEVLQSIPDILDPPTFGSIEDDLHGIDLRSRLRGTGEQIWFDVKAGLQPPSTRRARNGAIRVELGIPPRELDVHGNVPAELKANLAKLVVLGVQQGRAKSA